MYFFCASCQCKHPISGIAADLRDIARPDIDERIGEILLDNPNYAEIDDEILEFAGDLRKFVNTEAKSRKSFLFWPEKISHYLLNPMQNGMVLRGRFRLDMNWLIAAYDSSGAYAERFAENYGKNVPVDRRILSVVSSRFGTQAVFDRHLQFYFDRVDNDMVLDHIEDENGEPFYDEKRRMMLGYLRACPMCGRYVSRAVGHGEEIVVALAGSPRAGKSSCLTAVASSLSSGRYARFGLSMVPYDHDQSWELLKKEVEWFDRGYAVKKTPTDQRAVPSYSMLVKYFDKRRVFTFVDMPGEFWQSGNGLSAEFFNQYAGLFNNIDCIWFFVSKMTAYFIDLGDGKEDWQRRLIEQSAEDARIIRESSAANLAANMGLLRDHLRARGGRIPPIAVILTKMEMTLGVDDERHSNNYGLFPTSGGIAGVNQNEIGKVLKPRPGSGSSGKGRRVLDEREWFIRANKIRNFFREVNPGILSAVEENCLHRSYISMAAYGHPAAPRPKAMGESGEQDEDDSWDEPGMAELREAIPPTPFHEVFPLIWSLAIMGAVEIEHRCTWRWRTLLGAGKKEEAQLLLDRARFGERMEGNKTHEQDRKIATEDVLSNLLMENSSPGSDLKMKTSVFEHKR